MITRELAWPTNLVLSITESSHDLWLTWFSNRELVRPTTQVISLVISKQRARVTFDFSRVPYRERAWAATHANTRELAWPPIRDFQVESWHDLRLALFTNKELSWTLTQTMRLRDLRLSSRDRERGGIGKLMQALRGHGFQILRNKY